MNRIAALALALALATCGQPAQEAPPLAGARMGGPFALTGEDGRLVRESDFAGKYRLIYFGYTYCPDVCPVDMQKLMAGFRAFEQKSPALAEKLQPIFVSVDPARDTPAVVRQFTDAFHPRLLGLTGTPEDLAAVTKAYGIYVQKGRETAPGAYLVDHSRQATLYGPGGEPIALINEQGSAEEIAGELARWVR